MTLTHLIGDSLSHMGLRAPKEIIKKLQWWSKKRLGIQLKDLGDELEHGQQKDVTDCGIVAYNTAAHKIFEDPLWTGEKKGDERVQWFVTLTMKHINEVSYCPFEFVR